MLVAAGIVLVGGVAAVRLDLDESAPVPVPAAAGESPDPRGPGGNAGRAAPPAPEPVAPLPDRLAGLVADESLRARTFGVSVTTGDGREVFTHSAAAQLVPASSQKLLVAAAALTTLGPEFRYETALHATAAADVDGVVHGDLVLVGSGDPALGTPQYHGLVPERPRTPLEALADRAVASGVRRVTGGVVGDPGVFPHEPIAPGWIGRYLERGHTARSSGLTAEGGRRLFVEGGRLRSEPSADPAATAAAALHGLLVERGVDIEGSAGSSAAPPPTAVRLATVESPPLRDLLRYTVQRSDNQLADALFRTIGLAGGDATWSGAARAVGDALGPFGSDGSRPSLADGSGLSRSNRVSPAFLTALDVAMTRSHMGPVWRDLMAVAGRSGTLERRLSGTVADGRLRGKTGSLVDVSSLSGSVEGPGGRRYHFAVVGNRLDRDGQRALRQLQDLVVLVLAEDLHDCAWVGVPGAARDERQLRCRS